MVVGLRIILSSVLGVLLLSATGCASGPKITATARQNTGGFSVILEGDKFFINAETEANGTYLRGTCEEEAETITLKVSSVQLTLKTFCALGFWEILIPSNAMGEGTYSAELIRDLTETVAASFTIIKDITVPVLDVTLPAVDAPVGQLTGGGDDEDSLAQEVQLSFEEQAGLGCAIHDGYIVIPKQIAGGAEAVALSSNPTGYFRESVPSEKVTREIPMDGSSYFTAKISDEEARQLYETREYEVVSRNCLVQLNAITPNDPNFAAQYHHQNIQSTLAWELTTGDPTMIVAVLDTGVDPMHEDFFKSGQSILVPGANTGLCPCSLAQQMSGQCSINGNTVTYFPSGAQCTDVTVTTPVPSANPSVSSHGTWVAGVVGAVGNNQKGVAGVGWNLKIMPVRITDLNNGSAFFADIDSGVLYAAQNGAKIINASFSGGFRPSAQFVGAQARTLGALYVNSSGNSSQNMQQDCFLLFGSGSPLCTPEAMDHSAVTIVGASTQNDQRASFSSFGIPVDVVAPGVQIATTGLNNSYQAVNGTSFSSPMVAGILAMIRSVNPALTPDQAEQILFESADQGNFNPNEDGHGRANLYRGILAALAPEAYLINADNSAAFAFAGTCSEPSTTGTIVLSIQGSTIGQADCSEAGTWSTTLDLSQTPLDEHTEVQVDLVDSAKNRATVIRRLFRAD